MLRCAPVASVRQCVSRIQTEHNESPRRSDCMVSRREWLGRSLGVGATLALTPQLLSALEAHQQQNGRLIQRAIPSSGEMLPATGLSFSNHPGCADHAALMEILKVFYDGGGRVYDALH